MREKGVSAHRCHGLRAGAALYLITSGGSKIGDAFPASRSEYSRVLLPANAHTQAHPPTPARLRRACDGRAGDTRRPHSARRVAIRVVESGDLRRGGRISNPRHRGLDERAARIATWVDDVSTAYRVTTRTRPAIEVPVAEDRAVRRPRVGSQVRTNDFSSGALRSIRHERHPDGTDLPPQ